MLKPVQHDGSMNKFALSFLLALTACGPDWRAREMAAAEDRIRAEVDDPGAVFSQVQITGDSQTGQTCGYVKARHGPDAAGPAARFVVYIDGTSGPWIEKGMGRQFPSQDHFDDAWRADCVGEGWRPG
jgi:hypothetical protein